VTDNDGGTYMCVVKDQYDNTNDNAITVTVIGECNWNSYVFNEKHCTFCRSNISVDPVLKLSKGNGFVFIRSVSQVQIELPLFLITAIILLQQHSLHCALRFLSY
jgi:hypothetical protein